MDYHRFIQFGRQGGLPFKKLLLDGFIRMATAIQSGLTKHQTPFVDQEPIKPMAIFRLASRIDIPWMHTRRIETDLLLRRMKRKRIHNFNKIPAIRRLMRMNIDKGNHHK